MRRCALGGFRPVEFESEVKNWKIRQLELKNWNSKLQKNRKIGFLVIAHRGSHGFGPDLVGIFPRSLPQLSKQLRDQNNRQKPRKIVRNISKHKEKYYFMFFYGFFVILNFNCSALTVWFFNFWPQIRILRVEILLGHISACLKTSILKFRLL